MSSVVSVTLAAPEDRVILVSLLESYLEKLSAFRQRGFGRRAVAELWHRFPGPRELQIHGRNGRAIDFWSSMMRDHATSPLRQAEIDSRDGEILQYDFEVRVP